MIIRIAIVLLITTWMGYRYFVASNMTNEDLIRTVVVFLMVWLVFSYSAEIKAVLKKLFGKKNGL